jgi:hypothetical protein
MILNRTAGTLLLCGVANGYEFCSALPCRSLFSRGALALGWRYGIDTKQETTHIHMGALRTVIATRIRTLTAMITPPVIRILTAIRIRTLVQQAIHINIRRKAMRAVSPIRLKMVGTSRLTST